MRMNEISTSILIIKHITVAISSLFLGILSRVSIPNTEEIRIRTLRQSNRSRPHINTINDIVSTTPSTPNTLIPPTHINT
jgi:hypothetical protein